MVIVALSDSLSDRDKINTINIHAETGSQAEKRYTTTNYERPTDIPLNTHFAHCL